MTTRGDRGELASELRRLASRAERLRLPGGDDRLGRRRDWVVDTIRTYLLSRAEDPAAPLLVVFAGPTGAGKSTLLNSVVGVEHSPTGPLRPTTERPLLVASAERAERYRVVGGVECEVVVGRAPILTEATFADTPDLDSTTTRHRAAAETLVDHADIVVFVTSASRYADRVPWEVLRRAHSRSVPVIHVLNRVDRARSGAVPGYTARLAAAGLTGPLITVPEHRLRRGLPSLPLPLVQPIRDRLVELVEARRAGDEEIFARVLAVVVEEASAIVAVASGMETAVAALRSRLGDDLGFDLDRALSGVSPVDPTGLRLDELGGLAGRRLLIRWRARRRLPDPNRAGRLAARLDASLVAAVGEHFREWTRAHVGEGADLPRRLEADLERRVAGWGDQAREQARGGGALDVELGALLLRLACLGSGPPPMVGAALRAISSATPEEVCPSLLASLEASLGSWWRTGMEAAITSTGWAGIAVEEIGETRAAVSGVVARASFADA